MYQPRAFREDDLQAQHDRIREYPLGLLISSNETGIIADPVPFVLDSRASSGWRSKSLARKAKGK